MAPRRIVPSRSRSQMGGENPAPHLPSRPKSVMAKIQRSAPATATSREEASQTPLAPPSTSSLAHSKPVAKIQAPFQSQEDCEINIQVVVRCRRRSDREVQESSPIIVSTEGARSHAVSIETAAPVSSLGVVTFSPTRTYPFDLVFGPEADQSMIYQDVVHPMLEEVLLGYNCTLFAYGQTGTGKT
jgi:kinesin family protein 11